MTSSIDQIAAEEKANSPVLDTALKVERAVVASIHAIGRSRAQPVQKSPPERLLVLPPAGRYGGEYDPLFKLQRSEKALLERGAKGEAVAEPLQEVRNSIRATVEQRERERYRR